MVSPEQLEFVQDLLEDWEWHKRESLDAISYAIHGEELEDEISKKVSKFSRLFPERSEDAG